MRKVKIEGYVIYNEDELIQGTCVTHEIDHWLFNEDIPREWSFSAVSDEEVDYDEEDE
ncbi:hypothetical protein CHCC15325_3028 [Bacillus licheniformis]|uniref:Phage protein n=1 Tax=Bacillus glycinifermentans TaxID=1664069 RepID=A0ABU6H8H4_9BACI|nr:MULTISPECIES: hypothetical protein [Bacillus]ARC67948.1 hypothetical protein B34_00505 [Bacillus licheniformis]AVI45275.1 hypothetical protein BL14DL4_00006 [Bacillus licheniformis]AVI45452.1 hypothetical protein BL14DL4_00186 [Bacillus licheniformis]KYC83595.1 hypothetical protein B4091_2173 [Bacillus licheniformis]MCM3374103.1 hypothetical protein [Bacillus licheniformis]